MMAVDAPCCSSSVFFAHSAVIVLVAGLSLLVVIVTRFEPMTGAFPLLSRLARLAAPVLPFAAFSLLLLPEVVLNDLLGRLC